MSIVRCARALEDGACYQGGVVHHRVVPDVGENLERCLGQPITGIGTVGRDRNEHVLAEAPMVRSARRRSRRFRFGPWIRGSRQRSRRPARRLSDPHDTRQSGTKAAVRSTTSKRREPWVAAGGRWSRPFSLLTSSSPAVHHRTPRSHPVQLRTPMLLARAAPIRWQQNRPSSGRRDEGVAGLVRPGSVRLNRQRRESLPAVAEEVVRHGALSRSGRKPGAANEEVGRHPAMHFQTR